MKRIFPPSFYNPVTLIGAGIASVSFGLILFLIVLEALTAIQSPTWASSRSFCSPRS